MTDVLFKILFFLIAIPLFGWLLVSPPVFIWWFLDPQTRDRFTEQHDKLAAAVFIGAFLSLTLVLGQGIEILLVFIPVDRGGYNEHGEFVMTRGSIAITLGFFLSCFFVYVFDKYEKMRTENHRLSTKAEIQRRKDGLRYLSRETLMEERDRTETELERLRSRSYKVRLSLEERTEICVLEELLDELDGRMLFLVEDAGDKAKAPAQVTHDELAAWAKPSPALDAMALSPADITEPGPSSQGVIDALIEAGEAAADRLRNKYFGRVSSGFDPTDMKEMVKPVDTPDDNAHSEPMPSPAAMEAPVVPKPASQSTIDKIMAVGEAASSGCTSAQAARLAESQSLNQFPPNRVALKHLLAARAEPDDGLLFVLQLMLWRLENGPRLRDDLIAEWEQKVGELFVLRAASAMRLLYPSDDPDAEMAEHAEHMEGRTPEEAGLDLLERLDDYTAPYSEE